MRLFDDDSSVFGLGVTSFSIMPTKEEAPEPGTQVIDNPRVIRTPAQQRELPHIYSRNVCGGVAAYVLMATRGRIPVCAMCLTSGLDRELSLVANAGNLIGVKYAEPGYTCEATL